MRKLTILFMLIQGVVLGQYKIPYPTDADALNKLKTQSDLNDRLKEVNLTLNDVTIKLESKECIIPQSDEVCYNLYRESKTIEGTSYWVTYEIKSKTEKNGMSYKTNGYVYYTRITIGELTCKTNSTFTFDGAKVDAFTIGSKNGLISVADAEKMVLDTLRNGYDWYADDRNSRDYSRGIADYPEICRIDKLVTCDFGKEGCNGNYRVKNTIWEQTHIIAFETTVYEGKYEGGGKEAFRSMFCLNSMKTIAYCEFVLINGKPKFKRFYLSPDISNRTKLKECHYYYKPQDSLYMPMRVVGIDKVYGKFHAVKASENSLVNYRQRFSAMCDDLWKNLGKNHDDNVKLLSKYMTQKAAEETAKNYASGIIERKAKITSWKSEIVENDYRIEIKYIVQYNKKTIREFKQTIGTGGLKFENNQYVSNNELNFW